MLGGAGACSVFFRELFFFMSFFRELFFFHSMKELFREFFLEIRFVLNAMWQKVYVFYEKLENSQ